MIGLDLCFHFQKTEHLYHLSFSFYDFLNDKNLKFSIKVITLLSCTVKKNKNIKAYISKTINNSQEISTDLSFLGSWLGLQEI
jgi:glycine cleavage system protein P-like pyridoxal-binding family